MSEIGDVAPLSPGRGEEPQLVPLDRTAHREVDVPHLLQLRRRPQARVLQLLREVVALHGRAGAGKEELAGQRVAARARDDVDHRAADLGVGKPSGGADRDLGGVPGIDDQQRDAAGRAAGADPVHVQTSLGRWRRRGRQRTAASAR